MSQHETSWGSMPERLARAGGDPDKAAEALLAELSPEERLRMLSGQLPALDNIRDAVTGRYNAVPYPAASIPRLGFPGVRFADGPRGVVVGRSTAFPVPMARGATFDPELERRVGDAIGREVTAQGANLFAGICVNLLRHPAWGRAQETYGEDSHLLGEMGAALTESVGRHAATCVKHFACNSMENSRFFVDVEIDERDLRDLYLPHFRRCVEAGADAVMSAYNKLNGAWSGQHPHLLTEILKQEWGFAGFVMTDFVFGVRDMVDGVQAGQDLEMPMHWRARKLPRAMAAGRVPADRVRDAALRIARSLFEACRRAGGAASPASAVLAPEHLALSREVARRSCVLLRNEPVAGGVPALPMRGPQAGGPVRRLALIGRLADLPSTGDRGSSHVRSPHVATAADGLRALAPEHGLELLESTTDDLDPADRVAAQADAAVVVVGNTWRDEGEFVFAYGGDRSRLALAPRHVQLVERVASRCPRTAVVLVGGSAFVCEGWRERVPALLMAWYAGAEGGHALAEVLLGAAAPGGRLPCTWPRSEADLPPFRRWTRRIAYGPLHGYRLFHATGRRPAFWFGHGLGYAPLAWGAPRLEGDAVQVSLRNEGDGEASEVVQVYLDLALGSSAQALPTLAGFARVDLAPGEERTARVTLDPALAERARRAGGARVRAGRSADPEALALAGTLG